MKRANGNMLIIAVAIIILLGALAAAYLGITVSQRHETTQSIQATTAEQIAKGGLDMARAALLAGHANGWDDELTVSYNNNLTYNPAQPPIAVNTTFTPTAFQWARNIAYGGGYFVATVTNNNDGGGFFHDTDDKVEIRVQGFIASTRAAGEMLETSLRALVRFRPPQYKPDVAITSGGSLRLFGNATVTGTNGSIYADDNVNISGSAYVSQNVYSTGTITAGGGNIGGTSNPNSLPTELPSISPSAYTALADYFLQPDGKLYNKVGTLIGDATVNPVLGWRFSSNIWRYNDNACNNGTFYIAGGKDAEIASSPGSPGAPWQVTLLATGDVTVSGSPVMTPDETGVCILAEKDLVISGNLTVQNGLVATHEQMSITGSVDITGVIVAENATNTPDSLIIPGGKAIDVNIGGHATITYNGGLNTFLSFGDTAVVILDYKKEK